MKLNFIIILICSAFTLGACFSEKDEDIVHHDFNEDHAVLTVKEEYEPDTPKVWLSENAILLDLDSINVTIDSLDIYLDSAKSTKDTALIFLDIGSSLADHYFAVNSLYDSTTTEIIYQFETSLNLSNEGPHCDLIKWKHYRSTPDTLKLIDSTGIYQFKNSFLDTMSNAFPDVTMKEVRKAVLESCGKEWLERTEEATSINDFPFGVSISREIIRIQIKNTRGEILKEKFIIFEIPMGC